MTQPQLNPDALEAALRSVCSHMFEGELADKLSDNVRNGMRQHFATVVSAYLAAALPEVTSVEELHQLPVGAVVYASNHIGPAEKFEVGWMGCGNNAAWSSALLARDGLPARVLYRPSEQP